jgi:hypothetical protein
MFVSLCRLRVLWLLRALPLLLVREVDLRK